MPGGAAVTDTVIDKLIDAIESLASVLAFGANCEKTAESANALGKILADMARLRDQRKPKD
jgi:hypothetical protein